jgi:monoamine oxidase
MKNADQIEAFSHYITSRKRLLKPQYETLLADDLSRQQWQGCFQRNVLIVLERFYTEAFQKVQAISFDVSSSSIDNGMFDLTRQVLKVFHGVSDEFLLFVIDKHRTSCALSNFPDEHKPDKIYVNDVKRDIAELWKNFALNINNHFLECQ